MLFLEKYWSSLAASIAIFVAAITMAVNVTPEMPLPLEILHVVICGPGTLLSAAANWPGRYINYTVAGFLNAGIYYAVVLLLVKRRRRKRESH